jgi:hypothetical protein
MRGGRPVFRLPRNMAGRNSSEDKPSTAMRHSQLIRFDALCLRDGSRVLDTVFADQASFESDRADSFAAQYAVRCSRAYVLGDGLKVAVHEFLLSLSGILFSFAIPRILTGIQIRNSMGIFYNMPRRSAILKVF